MARGTDRAVGGDPPGSVTDGGRHLMNLGEDREAEAPFAAVDKLLAASVARRFYLEHQSKVSIAKEFRISRFKVARLLDAAVAHDIVRIDITVPAEIDAPLSHALAERFGLRQAVVVDLTRSEGDAVAPGDTRRAGRWLGTAAASLISEISEDDDVLGLDASRSVQALSEAVGRLRSREVVQLTGVHGPDLAHDTAIEAVHRTAAAGRGRAFPLHAPFILPNAPTATLLRSQPDTAETLGRFGRVTKAVVGIGAWEATLSAVYDALTERERDTYRALGACAEVAGHLFDRDGRPLPEELDARTIAPSAGQLREIPELIGVAGGVRRAGAIRAVLTSGLLTRVVTDATTARRLLWYDGAEDAGRVPDHVARKPEVAVRTSDHAVGVPGDAAPRPDGAAWTLDHVARRPEDAEWAPEDAVRRPDGMAWTPGHAARGPEDEGRVPDHAAGRPEDARRVPDHAAGRLEDAGRVPDHVARRPDATVRVPDHAVRRPEDAVGTSDHAARAPDDVARAPDGTAWTSDHAVRAPGDVARRPDGTAWTSDHAVGAPDHAARAPEDVARAPDHAVRATSARVVEAAT
ncbi:sugar-binding domain-containing protein [Streptomyces sp. NPDC006638]|uniref:sugar-binding domain-containing protein n=1 Tax=Streptomyces sp. NPDC006638 TaxID=3157183 RepID=UPI0033B5D7E0